jgi:hypothetical protein
MEIPREHGKSPRQGGNMRGIKELSERWLAYCDGWDAGLRRAALEFEGDIRDTILDLQRLEKKN